MFKKMFAVVISLSILFTGIAQAAANDTGKEKVMYKDVQNHWAAKDIELWSQKGLFSGNPDGTFKPDKSMTRAELCSVINKIFGYTGNSGENFSDVKPGKWYTGVAASTKAAGYTKGWKGTSFSPDNLVTRAEASIAMSNAFMLDSADSGKYLKSYKDLRDYKGDGADEISAVIANGFLKGHTDNTFRPDSFITRAEFVKAIDNAISELYSTKGSYHASNAAKNVIINTSGVTLENTVIQGGLYMTEGIGDGDADLNNVLVKGKTFINGGGENSIHISHSIFNQIIVKRQEGPVRIVSSHNNISSLILKSSVNFVNEDENALPDTVIDSDLQAGGQITLSGNMGDVVCNAAGATINISENSIIKTLTINKNAKGTSVKVAGKVDKAIINASGVKINERPIQQGAQGKIDPKTGEMPTVTVTSGTPAGSSSGNGNSGNGSSGNNGSGNNGTDGNTPPPPPQDDPWTLEWSDEFDGTTLDTTKWRPENSGGGFGNQEQQYYRPENATVKDGKLIISAKKENYGGNNYTSAKLFSKANWKYGKFEAKIKLPAGQGFWPAFWMMPSSDTYGGWAASGEIDIMEARGRLPGEVCGTLHYGASWPNNKFSGNTYHFPENQSISEYHTYSAEWEPGEIRFYVDGKLYQTQNKWNTKGSTGEEQYSFPAPFDQNFYLMLNLAIGGTFDGGLTPDDSMFPAQMEVDYVRVYKLTGRPYKTPTETYTQPEPLPSGARQPDTTGNLIMDTGFEQGIKDNTEGVDSNFGDVWNFVHNSQFGASATANTEKIGDTNFAKINVANKGSQVYSVQLEQLTTLGKGRWYKYSFDAKADKDRILTTKLGGGPSAGWAAYSDSYSENLTVDMKHFEHVFQMNVNSDTLARVEFNCAADTGTLWIGNARLEEIAPPQLDYSASKPPLPISENNIYNGAFDKYSIDRMAYWNVSEGDSVASVSVPENTRELTVDIARTGVNADSLIVSQKGLQLMGSYGYALSFKARSAAARAIKVKVSGMDGTTAYMPETEINLTTQMQQFSIPFVMGATPDMNSQLVFMLGGNDSDVYIDDVSLNATTKDYSGVDLYPLNNGDFSGGLKNWETFNEAGGAFSTENGEAKVAISNVGTENWKVMLMQTNMKLSKGMEYEFSFDASASVNRDIEASLENSSYIRSFQTGSVKLTPDKQHFSYTFKMENDEILALKFLLGKTAEAAVGDVFIDNVILRVKDAPVEMAPDLNEDISDTKVGQDIDILFNDNENWRTAVKAVKVDGTAVDSGLYSLTGGSLIIPGEYFKEGKIYTIAVEAEGYENAIVLQHILPDDGNLLQNGDMSKGDTAWTFWNTAPDWSGYSISEGTAAIKINYHGAKDDEWGVPFSWSTQFKQTGIKLQAGKTYELSFKAWCNEFSRPIQVELTDFSSDKLNFDITNDSSTVYSKSFTATADKTMAVNFLMGYIENGSSVTPDGEHTVFIDDVVIKEVTQ